MAMTSLEQVRAIARPSREAMLARDISVQQFWAQNTALFEQAWAEWVERQTDADFMLMRHYMMLICARLSPPHGPIQIARQG